MTKECTRVYLFLSAATAAALTSGVPPAFAQSAVTITGTSCASWSLTSSNGSYTLTCNSAPVPQGAPTGCAIASSPVGGALGSAGGAITMTASCSGGTVTSWSWTKSGGGWGSGAASQNDQLPANTGASSLTYTYSVTACNGTSCASPVITTFTVAAGNVGGGGGGGAGGACPGISGTTTYVNIPWGAGAYSYPSPQMGSSDAIVGILTTPSAVSPTGPGGAGRLEIDPYGGGGVYQWVTISTSPCVWNMPDGGFSEWASPPNWWVSFGNPIGDIILQPNTTYYVNIRNWDPYRSKQTCSYNCGIVIYFGKPSGS